jgi:hypothetical protein
VPALLPLAFAALASLDSQHHVVIEQRGGHVSVVLQHASPTEAARHLHGPLARILTAFAEQNGPTQDHILTFCEVGSARVSAPVPLPLAIPHAEAPMPVETRIVPPHPRSFDAPALAARPPPTGSLALVCLRSTTLLV